MRRLRRICLIALGALVGLYIVATAAWAVDTHVNAHRVARNTTLAGRQIGGLEGARLQAAVVAVAEKYQSSPVVVDAPDGGFTTKVVTRGVEVTVNFFYKAQDSRSCPEVQSEGQGSRS